MTRWPARSPRNFFPLAVALLSLVVAGCVVGEELTRSGLTDPDPTDEPESEDCEGQPTIDLALLQPCCEAFGGDAHCVPSSRVPDSQKELVDICDNGGYCIPDKFILAGGAVETVPCLSVNGDGVCMSSCIPQVQENYDLLTQDICDVTERCVPCINPLTGEDSGACNLESSCGGNGDECPDGPHEGPPLIDPNGLEPCTSCVTGGAHCMPSGLISGDLGDRLADCDADTKCVPDEFIASGGAFEAPTCRSVGGGEGRCLSRCLPEVAEKAHRLPQDICPATHLCVPCTDPLNGDDTGACVISCDLGPTEPPLIFPKCCDGRGTCIPPENAGEDSSSLGRESCPDGAGLLCAPDVLIDETFVAQSCFTSSLFGDPQPGACLHDCLGAVDNIFVGQGTCPGGYKCAPCNGPFGGSTGACDYLP